MYSRRELPYSPMDGTRALDYHHRARTLVYRVFEVFYASQSASFLWLLSNRLLACLCRMHSDSNFES